MAPEFAEIGVEVYGAAADSVERLAKFRAAHAQPFQLISDPELTLVDTLGIATSERHPMSRTYPKGSFMQPSVFFFGVGGEVLFSWLQTPKLLNFYGARDRMGPRDVLAKARELVGRVETMGGE